MHNTLRSIPERCPYVEERGKSLRWFKKDGVWERIEAEWEPPLLMAKLKSGEVVASFRVHWPPLNMLQGIRAQLKGTRLAKRMGGRNQKKGNMRGSGSVTVLAFQLKTIQVQGSWFHHRVIGTAKVKKEKEQEEKQEKKEPLQYNWNTSSVSSKKMGQGGGKEHGKKEEEKRTKEKGR